MSSRGGYCAEIVDGVLQVTFPGFCEDDTTTEGLLRLDKLEKLLQFTGYLALDMLPSLKHISLVNRTLVLVSDYITFKPELYLLIAGGRSRPYKTTTKVCSAGRASFVIETFLSEIDDGSTLIKCYTKLIYVDWSTRRPVPLPAELRNSVRQEKHSGKRVKFPEIPKEAFSYEVEIQPCDLDKNQHTNLAAYVRICSDTAYEAAAKSFYRMILDVSALPLLEMLTLCTGESTEGDLLTVRTWQAINNVDNIYFGILKENVSIFHCRWKVLRFPIVLQALL